MHKFSTTVIGRFPYRSVTRMALSAIFLHSYCFSQSQPYFLWLPKLPLLRLPLRTVPAQSFDLSDEVVRDVLAHFQRGLETTARPRPRRLRCRGYARLLASAIRWCVLPPHDSIKFRYQLLQVDETKDAALPPLTLKWTPSPPTSFPPSTVAPLRCANSSASRD